ncbi:MAG: VOC family protein [Allorhizobium sp.]
MRIESGLSSYSYQNRYVHNATEGEDAAAETATSSKPRTASSPAFSSTLLSPSLATALWTIEGGRKGVSPTPAQASDASSEALMSSAEKVEALYREYELAEDSED